MAKGMSRGRPRRRGRPPGPAAAPPCAAPAPVGGAPRPIGSNPNAGERRRRPRVLLLLAELEALIAEQERGARPVDLHEHEVVIERGPRLRRVDLAVDLHVELLPPAADADQLHVVIADQDLVPRVLATASPAAASPTPGRRRGGRGRRRWRRKRR